MKNKIQIYIPFLFLSFLTFISPVFADGRTQIKDMNLNCNVIPQGILDILKSAWFFILVAGPIVFIIVSLIDLAQTITSSDDGQFKKFFQKTIKRIIGLVILLILPLLINFTLGLINDNFSSCVN